MAVWSILPNRAETAESVVKQERARVYRVALAITSSHEAAEDVTQEVVCRFLKHFSTIKNTRAWLQTTTVRCALEAHPQTTKVDLPEDVIQRSADPDEALAVAQTLAQLSIEHRTILALALLEQLSYKEIARTLDIPIGSVASRLHLAKQAFRSRWQS